MDSTLQILVSEEGAEAERLADLTRYLREELLQLDVDDVKAAPGEEPPPGARVVGVVEVGTLLVTLGSSVTALNQVVGVLRDWLGRFRNTREDTRPALKLKLGDDVLEISEASDEQVAQALGAFLQRHSATSEARP
ncbi:hypothetical protein [Streptomyces lanatus]|uniref:Uncharacterized protein n=1 Tax=Streptomyces lanatus TaxID=66900 RepID=A0ABV1XXR2_9ACTN|nr:hypothetical protein [Streptomyces lanatus]GHH17593.1 hypothetical protein GCM10018780_61230 [Streptomyces lanatus]